MIRTEDGWFKSKAEYRSWLIELEALCDMCNQRIPLPGCLCGYTGFPRTWGEWIVSKQDEYRHEAETRIP